MKKYLLFLCIMLSGSLYAQTYSLSGKVVNPRQESAVGYALVTLPTSSLWAITDDEGDFVIRNIPTSTTVLTISCLGYVKTTFEVDLTEKTTGFVFRLPEDNLLLNEVVVTAKRNEEEMSTSYTIDRTTLDHLQMMNVGDISGLLPGGKTNTQINMASSESAQYLEIRTQGSTEMGNAIFGSAIMVDGVRMSTNSYFSGYSKDSNTFNITGFDVRSIGTSNIESIEVITGIPSVEYGDLTNGMIKINSRKGKTPWIFDVVFKPYIKQYSGNKGFDLGNRNGVLNMAYEHSRSTKDTASPYTTYIRNNISLQYSNTLNKNGAHPLMISAGLSGNVGGYNSESDPDLFVDTYYKRKDNNLRFNTELNWLVNKPWLTNLQASGTVYFANKTDEQNSSKSSSASSFSVHTKEEGYHVAEIYDNNPDAAIKIIPAGYWYELKYREDKPLEYTAKLKATWAHTLGNVSNRAMAGGEFARSNNKGRGFYYDDMRYAPSWREYRYDELPATNNFGFFAEDKVTVPVSQSVLELMAGVRSDITTIKGSEYGTVSSFSPRFNLKFRFKEHGDKYIQDVVLRAGWSKSVKLPPFVALFPEPSYTDIQSFASPTHVDGSSFVAYYTIPHKTLYNPDLKWQYSIYKDLGVEFKVGQIGVALTAYHSKVMRPYLETTVYTPFTYKLTNQSALSDISIPSANRTYSVDRTTGVVTVSDRTGMHQSEELEHTERSRYWEGKQYVNGSPSVRKGLEWVVNFGRIPALNTTIQVDGQYYNYKGVEETPIVYGPQSNITSADGSPYKYRGVYIGTNSASNGSSSRQITNNITITTHIPSIRLIISARIEASLYNNKQYLSEYGGGNRSFVLNSNEDYFPSATQTDIYGGDRFVGMYPLYYYSIEDVNTLIPFEEAFLNAKDNEPGLYNDLARLVTKSNTSYFFNQNKTSVFWGANLSVTKEIGDFLSISFNANNFLNSLQRIRTTWPDSEITVHNNSIGSSKYSLPSFYYGLSLRLKL